MKILLLKLFIALHCAALQCIYAGGEMSKYQKRITKSLYTTFPAPKSLLGLKRPGCHCGPLTSSRGVSLHLSGGKMLSLLLKAGGGGGGRGFRLQVLRD